MEEKIVKNTGAKYSEMIIQMYEQFDEHLPEKWTMEQVFELCIEAWNLALKKNALGDSMYNSIINVHKQGEIVNNLVNYKDEYFKEFKNFIVDFSTTGNRLQIKSQPPEVYFNSIMKNLLSVKKEK